MNIKYIKFSLFVLTLSLQYGILQSTTNPTATRQKGADIMANSFLQVRVDENDKERASQILEHLGTNLSTVVNMLIKQIILTESIPFEIKMGPQAVNSSFMPQSAAAAFENHSSDLIENPVIKGIREEYESF